MKVNEREDGNLYFLFVLYKMLQIAYVFIIFTHLLNKFLDLLIKVPSVAKMLLS